jgi:hypothetical protein
MKRSTFAAIAPFITVLGACSGGSTSNNQPPAADSGGGGEATTDDGGTTTGDDGSTPNPTTPFEANLSGAEVVPSVQTGASGKGSFQLSADGTTLAYQITFTPASFQPSAVNVHIGAVGESTTVSHQLTPTANPMSGQISLSMDEQGAVVADGLYVDVPTAAFPGGELRGQVIVPGSEIFVAYPAGDQQVPVVNSAYSSHASFILSPDQANLRYHLATDAMPSDVRLHRAIGGVNGPVAYDLPLNSGSPIDGIVQLGGTAGSSDPTDLEKGRFYVNIVTQQNPAGELRGQLVRPGEVLLTGVLSGANEVPPVTSLAGGGTHLIVGADRSSVRYEAVVTGIIPISAEIGAGAVGANGSTLFQLTLNMTGAFGTTQMSSNDMSALLAGGDYVNVRTPSYPAGELRAQLTVR